MTLDIPIHLILHDQKLQLHLVTQRDSLKLYPAIHKVLAKKSDTIYIDS